MKGALKTISLFPAVYLLFAIFPLKAQYLENPSFEGDVRDNYPPPPWDSCSFGSSPDTPPGIINIFLAPQDGNTYVSLRTRAANPTLDPQYQATVDRCAAPLLIPLEAQRCYSFTVALARDTEVDFYGEDEPLPTEPVKFQVWGYTDNCEEADLLAETEAINNLEWQDYELSLVPQETYTSIVLQSNYVTEGNTYHGMNLVDNIRIEEVSYGYSMRLDTAVNFNTTLQLNASEGVNYQWNDPNDLLSCTDCQSPVTTIYDDAIYYVEFENSTGCNVQEQFSIHSLRCQSISTVVKMDESLDIGDTPILEASWSPMYTWYPTVNLSCEHCQTPIATIYGPAQYQCEIYDDNGCTIIERFIIDVEIHIPDVFTPNRDGINDLFVIRNLPEGAKLKVFDRNGIILFESDNYQQDWDGSDKNGKLLNQDNYWYTLTLPYAPDNVYGNIYLKRN